MSVRGPFHADSAQRGLMLLALAVAAALSGCRWRMDTAQDWQARRPPAVPAALVQTLDQDHWRLNPQWTLFDAPRSSPDGTLMRRWIFGAAATNTKWTESAEPAEPAEPAETIAGQADPPSPEASGNDANEEEKEGAEAKTPDADETESIDAGADDVATAETAHWNGLSPLSLDEILRMFDASGTATAESTGSSASIENLLAVLAQRDELPGWNAAILWAQRDPAQAVEVVDVLERLAISPSSATFHSSKASEDASGKDTVGNDVKKEEEEADPIEKTDEPSARRNQRRPLSMTMRRAAADAWCAVLAAKALPPLDALAPAGRALERADLPDPLRVELFLAVARTVPPALIPRLEIALRVPDAGGRGTARAPAEIRRAAVEACLVHAASLRRSPHVTVETAANEPPAFDPTPWPATLDECRFDPDARVRRLYGQWLAVVRHPDALAHLKSQLLDTDIRVREEALLSLGRLGTDEARAELQRQLKRPESRVREFAVRAVARWGAAEIVPLAGDTAFNVRQAVATELAAHPQVEAALALQDLLVDLDPQVQMDAAQAVADWPDELAIPLLLHAMRDSSRLTRRYCAARLGERIGESIAFDFESSRTQRAQDVARIAREAKLPLGYLGRLQARERQNSSQVDSLQIAEVQALLRDLAENPPQSPAHAAARQRLLKRSPADVAIIEQTLTGTSRSTDAILYREILPHLSPVYAALAELESRDVFVRRRGAQQLAQLSQNGSLSAAALRRLAEHLTHEQDRLVWRYAMNAVMRDASEGCARIAELAANHVWPDICVQGCDYAARHGRPQFATWLLPLLHHRSRDVQLAAVRAAGRCRHPLLLDGVSSDSGAGRLPGLRPLLTHADDRLRMAAAVSMSRLGDTQGIQELVRLSFHESAVVREDVVRAMGETGHTRFIEHLVRLGWTEPNTGVQRAILASLDRLIPPPGRPPGLAEVAMPGEKIKIWMNWWQRQQPPPLRDEPAAASG